MTRRRYAFLRSVFDEGAFVLNPRIFHSKDADPTGDMACGRIACGRVSEKAGGLDHTLGQNLVRNKGSPNAAVE
jgi:hypothetical protein